MQAPAKKRAARRPSAPPARPLPLADSARLLTRADGGPKRPGVPPAARGAPASTKRRAANGADVPAAKRARPPPAAGPAQHAAAPTALTRARCPPAADPPPLCEAGVAAEGAAFLAEVQAARGLRDGSAPAWRGGPGLAALPLPLDLGQHGFLAEEAREEDSVSLLEVRTAPPCARRSRPGHLQARRFCSCPLGAQRAVVGTGWCNTDGKLGQPWLLIGDAVLEDIKRLASSLFGLEQCSTVSARSASHVQLHS